MKVSQSFFVIILLGIVAHITAGALLGGLYIDEDHGASAITIRSALSLTITGTNILNFNDDLKVQNSGG